MIICTDGKGGEKKVKKVKRKEKIQPAMTFSLIICQTQASHSKPNTDCLPFLSPSLSPLLLPMDFVCLVHFMLSSKSDSWSHINVTGSIQLTEQGAKSKVHAHANSMAVGFANIHSTLQYFHLIKSSHGFGNTVKSGACVPCNNGACRSRPLFAINNER